jgi:hypothetical protein
MNRPVTKPDRESHLKVRGQKPAAGVAYWLRADLCEKVRGLPKKALKNATLTNNNSKPRDLREYSVLYKRIELSNGLLLNPLGLGKGQLCQ